MGPKVPIWKRKGDVHDPGKYRGITLSGGETTKFGDGMLRPSPNHGTLRLPNDDDDHTTQPCTETAGEGFRRKDQEKSRR